MCDPASIGLGLQIGSSVVGLFSERKQTNAYAEYQQKQAQASINNYIYQTKAVNNHYAEEQAASAIEQQHIAVKNMQAKATAQASAASSGIEGLSLNNLYRDYDRATAASQYIAAKNLHFKGLQYTDELDSMRYQALSSINLQQQYQSNLGASLLGGVGNALSSYAYMDYRKERLKQNGAL